MNGTENALVKSRDAVWLAHNNEDPDTTLDRRKGDERLAHPVISASDTGHNGELLPLDSVIVTMNNRISVCASSRKEDLVILAVKLKLDESYFVREGISRRQLFSFFEALVYLTHCVISFRFDRLNHKVKSFSSSPESESF